MNEQQRQAYLDQINYGRIERVIAYKNVQFILEHQNDTLEQLSAYLQSCMEDIGHPPAPVEVIGADYIIYRFGSWQAAIRLSSLPERCIPKTKHKISRKV
mgnify:CR=1 FL=1